MTYAKKLEKYRKRREAAKRMLASGLSVIRVAALLGITRQRVYQITK